MTSLSLIARHELNRLRFRLEIVWRSVVAACLWLGISVLWTTAASVDLGLLVVIPLVLLAVAGLPILAVQVGMLVDLLMRLLTGEIAFYPRLIEGLRRVARERAENGTRLEESSRALKALVWTVDALSPLSGIATWAFAVLARMPESSHAAITSPLVKSQRVSAGRSLRRVEGSVLTRFWHYRHPTLA